MSTTNTMSLDEAKAVLSAHHKAEYDARVAHLQTLVGRYFKYRNSYSAGNKWWMYAAVTGVSDYGTPAGWTFQKTNDGEIMIRNDSSLYVENVGYKEITASEFRKAAAALLADVSERLTN